MKRLFLLAATGFILMSFDAFSETSEDLQNECDENEIEEEGQDLRCIKRFKMPASYENSVIVDPIDRERDAVNMRPNSYESSFYEQMTR